MSGMLHEIWRVMVCDVGYLMWSKGVELMK